MAQEEAKPATQPLHIEHEEGGDFRYGAGEHETLKGKIIKASAVSMYAFIGLGFILSLVAMVKTLLLSTSSTSMVGVIQFIEQNIETPPISDIQLAAGRNCPSEFQTLQIGTYPGTSTGCYCSGLSIKSLRRGSCGKKKSSRRSYLYFSEHENKLSEIQSEKLHAAFEKGALETCASDEDDEEVHLYFEEEALKTIQIEEQRLDWADSVSDSLGICRTVYSTSSAPLTAWKNTSFCATYYSPSDYKWASKSCGAGYQRCQQGLCIRSGLQCPITSLSYIVNANNSRTLQIVRNTSEPVLLSLQVESDGQPCLSTNNRPKNANSYYYPLLNNIPTGCGNYGSDEGAATLDTQLELQLYRDNGLSNVLSLPKFTEYILDQQVSLFARPRIQFNTNIDTCLQLDSTYFEQASSGIDTAGKVVSFLTLFSMVFAGVSGILALNILKGRNPLHLWEARKNLNIFAFLSVTVVMVLVLVTLLKLTAAEKQVQSGAEYFNGIQNSQCFQNANYTSALIDFAKTPEAIGGLFLLSLITFICLLLLYIVYTIGFGLVLLDRPN